MGFSLKPETFVDGGAGILNNVDAQWKQCRFVMWDYNGTQSTKSPALCIDMVVDGESSKQYFSAGSDKEARPSEDGKTLIPVGTATGINKNSKLAILLNSLIAAKFPMDLLGEDISVFEGGTYHMVRVPSKEMAGIDNFTVGKDGKKYPKMDIVVDHIIKLPGEARGGKTASPEADTALTDMTKTAIMNVMISDTVMGNGGVIEKKKLAQEVFTSLKAEKRKSEAVKMCYDDAFLTSIGMSVNGTKVSM